MKPLTKEDEEATIIVQNSRNFVIKKLSGYIKRVNYLEGKEFYEGCVEIERKKWLSALALAKKKIKELMLNKFGYTECEESLKILDECFDIQGQDAKGSDKTQKGNCLKTVDTVSSNKDSTQVRKSTNPSSQVPARCSRLETHNFPNLLNKTKCKWCGKTIKELIGSDKN